MNGKARIGFITNGVPKLEVHFILNILGIIENLPTFKIL